MLSDTARLITSKRDITKNAYNRIVDYYGQLPTVSRKSTTTRRWVQTPFAISVPFRWFEMSEQGVQLLEPIFFPRHPGGRGAWSLDQSCFFREGKISFSLKKSENLGELSAPGGTAWLSGQTCTWFHRKHNGGTWEKTWEKTCETHRFI